MLALLIAYLFAAPALAQGDELSPVAAVPLVGKAYSGVGQASQILFVNTRRSAVRLNWIAFDGTPRFYATIAAGDEITQRTFVSHRWFVTRDAGSAPIEAFISTRADVHSDGQAQIAIIR